MIVFVNLELIMSLNFSARFIKKNGKLHVESKNKKLYEAFLNGIEEGDVVEFFMQIQSEDGTLAQLAKLHAIIKDIALHTRQPFSDIKLVVKENSGMCYKGNGTNGETFTCKSFGDCDRNELGLAIEAAEELAILTGTKL